MGRRFTMLVGLFSDETRSEYIPGMCYEVDDGNDMLNGLVDQWIADGKAREGGAEAQVSGGDAPLEDDESRG